ncbi:MYCB2 ligase, partial [Polypterus senegalus]
MIKTWRSHGECGRTSSLYTQLAMPEAEENTKSENLEGVLSVPDIKLHSNPSAFNVYCNVRHCVLEWQQKEASLALASKTSVQSGDSDSDEEEESKEPPIKLPKIIGIGLCGVFELIKETRFSHPSLCLRSLQALLDMLQGQQPEGFQSEPPDVLESLFHLLLEITIRSTGMNDSTGQALTALSCACLFSLVVAWGDTGKILQAVSAILTNNGSNACQAIQVPAILNSLQRSVQAVLVGKIQIQDWFSNGIKKAALMNKWILKEVSIDDDENCLLQSDGSFLYLLCKDGLYKVGSGYSGTVRGHVYNSTSRIRNRKERKSWLGYAQGYLLYQDMNNHNMTALKINPETLEQEGAITMPGLQADGQNIVFTDGEYINQIAACRDDGFVVRIYATSTEPTLQQELQLKLARKCLHACGISLFDLEKDLHIISTGFDEEAAILGAGREFALMKTANGKIYYTGKYQSLGIKQGGPSAGKWVELPITKSPKIVQFSVAKSRRQPKPYKPKKIIKMEGKIAVYTACNNGSSSIVTKDGELYMFGKDAVYSDSSWFGVENMATAMDEDLEEEVDDKEEKSMMCPPGMHKWKLDQCMVCTVCGDCTGYGASCVSSGRPDRVPGGICGCGSGESGCSACGCCKACARELDGQEARQRGIFDAVKEMIPLDLLLGVNIEEHIQIRQEEKRQRINRRHRLEEGRGPLVFPGPIFMNHREQALARLRPLQAQLKHKRDKHKDGSGERGDKDASKITTYPPGTVRFDCDLRAVQKGQLGRPILDMPYWNAKPSPMPNIGAKYGRKATWIGASGDQTFLRIDEALINSHVLATSEVFASKHIIGLVPASLSEPPPFRCLLINKMDGSCRTFNDSEQEDLQGFGVCLDPVYDVIWRFLPASREFWCYNSVIADARSPCASDLQTRCCILSPELALPAGSQAMTTRSHGALHILGCLDTLAAMQELKMGVTNTEEETQAVLKVYSKEDYGVVNRFESHGGGWGYSAHSVEAIRFCADVDILLGGLGLFGGRGEYTAKIKLFELGPDGGDHETDGDLLAETDVLAYDCAARLPSNDGNSAKGKQQTSEPVHILKRSFARTVSVECFESLLSILHWSWTTLVLGVDELRGLKGFQYTATLLDLERLRFVGTCCLRLLRVYICEIYPISASSKAVVEESSKLAECVGKTRSLLRKILSEGIDNCAIKLDNDPQGYLSQPLTLLEAVLQECHNTFTACFHSFYPTPALQWACLCDLLNCLDQDIQEANFRTSSSRLLAAVMSALCNTSVKLTSILPIAYDGEVLLRSLVKQVSTENDSALAHRFPLLVAHMEKLSHSEENLTGLTSFREVLEKMLVIVVLPVRKSLRKEMELFSPHLVSNTCGLIASIVSELTASALGSEVDGLNSMHSVKATPNRFTKTSQGRSWNTGNGSPDAICFSVDKHGVVLVGFCVYGGGGIHEYELEVLADDTQAEHPGDSAHSHRWTSLELVKGTYSTDDSPSDIAEIRLDKVVPLKENVKYAVRLRNYGSRTANGDGGMTTVQCPDGVTFTFSTCSLSSNGTNQTRGQIPQILYYRSEYDGDLQSQILSKANEEDKNCSRSLSVVSAVVRAAKDLLHRAFAVDAEDIPELLSSSSLFSMLLPLILAYIGPVAASVPKAAVEVFGLVQELLPAVSALNQKYAPPAFNPNQSTDSTTGNQPEQGLSACTTSSHYAVIESDHPYKQASVTQYKVCNEALFSLETASDYVKDDKACFFGFKCVAVGYEFNPGTDEGIIQLEKELAYLGGLCAAALMKKDLALPIGNELEEDLEILEESSLQVCKAHAGILGKGLALSRSPSILEALEGNLPLHLQSNEHSFLEDFITCVENSSGGRLARWLQPDSYADPQKTSLILNKDDIRCGWPTTVTVQTKDQYGDVVHVPNMKVEVKAVPVSQKKSLPQDNVRKLQRIPGSPMVVNSGADMTYGGLPPPKLESTYEPMIVKEARYIAITMMKVYENYSFEELRFASPTPKRPSENMLIRANTDGTYNANWTPGAVGLYTIHVTIDGIEIDAGLEVEVKDPPKGMIPPGSQLVKPKVEPQPSKVRKFVAKDSAGLRIRSHPSLQSEQIGIVKVNGTITFIDEIHNDDGVWLRLNDETVKKYVPNMNGYTEAWCLSFNQHLGRSLLVPVDGARIHSDYSKETNARCSYDASIREQDTLCLRGGPGAYKVVRTGPSGHNIRSCPNLRGIPIGMLVLGNKLKAVGEVTNSEGTWVQLDKNSIVEFCESDEGEAWSLARDRGGSQYLRHEEEQTALDQGAQTPPPSPFSVQAFSRGATASGAQGFDYGIASKKGDQLSSILNSIQSRPFLPAPSVFEQAAKPPCSLVHSPFVFGQSPSFQQPVPQLPSERGNISTVTRPLSPAAKSDNFGKHRTESRSPKLDGRISRASTEQGKMQNNECLSASESLILKSDTAKLRSDSHSRSLSPNHNTLQALKADGRTCGLRAESPTPGSRSSSPKAKALSSGRTSPSSTSSPRSSSPYEKNLSQKVNVTPKSHLDPPRERSKSDSYTLDPDTLRKKKVPLTEPLRGRSTSPKLKNASKSGNNTDGRAPSPHVVQENLHSEVVEICTSSALLSNDDDNEDISDAKCTEEGMSKVHFSIGKAPIKDDQETRSSPKVSRKTADRKVRTKKERSGPLFKGECSRLMEPAKQAMSPSVAECARAVFAAFLWHEGIVHDAMACSSFLKFNPELSKEHAPIRNSLSSQQVLDEKESKLKNRHSLEISSALNMFNIAPHGPDISKMGSINKNKVLSMLKEPPLHEKCEDGKTDVISYDASTHTGLRTKSPLPLTLQHLVAFWEDISLATIKAATQNMIFPSPGSSAILKKKDSEKDCKKGKKEKKKKEKTEIRPRGNLFGEMAQLAMGGPEKDTICELCGESHPYPVTYHMRQAHPGCGRYAGGQGYNSIGHFCGGWAGNCGDGGIGGSTWYLVCDRCREKYLREKQSATREKVKQSRKKPMQVKTPRALPTMEAHQVIRANALFLLSLSSAAEPSILCYHPPKPPHSQLPSVKEGVSEELPNKIGCLYLQTLARHHSESFGGYQDDNLFQDEMRYLRSTSVPAPYISVTPDASPNVFEEPESNMKSMPPSLETSPITDSDTAKRTVFQRSYSVVASEYDKQHSTSPARVKAIPRRRVNSGDAEVGSSLLRHPSPELSRLISAHGSLSKGERNFQWPVLAFVIQHHDLEGLEVAMKHALKKSACRVFAMEAFNWLLCNVIQTTSLHDILWHFVASLTPSPSEPEEEDEEENKANKENAEQVPSEKDTRVCEHPLSDIVIAGEAAHPLPHTFHRLLQTISDLMMSLPSGSSLQQMALRCWSLKFKQSDHQFLHQSNVFHHINNILSKSDDGDSEESFNISVQSGYEAISQDLCIVTCLKDLTGVVDIKTSSRPAMIGSLTDGSTETFWESGDEDKNKTKSIIISCVKGISSRYVSVHVDNSRDIGVDLDSRHIGWVTSELPGCDNHIIKMELKGPENTLRVRQVKVLGWKDGESIKIAGQISASVAQQKNCEAETLRVFRLITSQVFGKLICGDTEPTPEQEEKTLLSSPEGEDKVCAHIVQAIRMEATRVREEWEHAISSKENANSQPNDEDASSDAYCFELLSMVLALSGSNVGRQYLAQQLTLMQDLFSLLHTASPRVQRQVTSLLRRVLPEVTPARLASIIGVKVLPPADISDIIHSTEKGDWNKLGILDMFLGCIAKALTVQLKAKGTTIAGTTGTAAGKGVTTVTLPMIFNSSYIRRGESHWWMKGSTPTQIAEIIIKLVKDMAAGHLSEAWSRVTKNAIAETIIALTKMEEEHRSPVRCIATTRPMCDNHDDGETAAIILCNACGNLCTDCDRFLHLHRRTRTHQRQVFKEEEEAIKVDLHEGCGRTKLFWLMALADSKTMKAMVEFREHTGKPASSTSEACRFCGSRNGTELSSVGSVCSDADCQNKINHHVLKDLLDPIKELYEDVRRKALMRLEYEGLHKSEAITTAGARFHNDPAGFAMNRYAYYVCYKCKKAYFGGEARCDAEAGQGDDYDPRELICGACSDVSRAQEIEQESEELASADRTPANAAPADRLPAKHIRAADALTARFVWEEYPDIDPWEPN